MTQAQRRPGNEIAHSMGGEVLQRFPKQPRLTLVLSVHLGPGCLTPKSKFVLSHHNKPWLLPERRSQKLESYALEAPENKVWLSETVLSLCRDKVK